MVNTNELNAAIARAGYTQGEVAKEIGLSSYTFGRKAKNLSKFDLVEVEGICNFLGIVDNLQKALIFLS